MQRIIINADDFGISKEANQGIKMAILAGKVNSVSVMVNTPYFQDAVAFLKKHPKVLVGLHFNITEGKKYTTLLRTIFSLITRKKNTTYLKKEVLRQYLKLQKTGLEIAHVDSHEHIHLYPPIFRLMHTLAVKTNIPRVRGCSFSRSQIQLALQVMPTIKQLLLWTLYSLNYLFLPQKNARMSTITCLFDLNWHNNFSKQHISKLFRTLSPGTTEVICHVSSKVTLDPLSNERYKCLSFLVKDSDTILQN